MENVKGMCMFLDIYYNEVNNLNLDVFDKQKLYP